MAARDWDFVAIQAFGIDTLVDPVSRMIEKGTPVIQMDTTISKDDIGITTFLEPDNIFMGGQSKVVGAFDAIEKVREVLAVLERQLVVVSLIRDVLARGQMVSIGSETGVEPLNDCSLVVAPYEVDGQQVGTIGVLGPTRLNYPQALSAVAVVSQRLGDRLSEG